MGMFYSFCFGIYSSFFFIRTEFPTNFIMVSWKFHEIECSSKTCWTNFGSRCTNPTNAHRWMYRRFYRYVYLLHNYRVDFSFYFTFSYIFQTLLRLIYHSNIMVCSKNSMLGCRWLSINSLSRLKWIANRSLRDGRIWAGKNYFSIEFSKLQLQTLLNGENDFLESNNEHKKYSRHKLHLTCLLQKISCWDLVCNS